MSKIGIVGGAGYIGSSLALQLSKSFEVKALDIKPLPKDLEGKVEYERCDVQNYNEVEQKLRDVELVIHAAIVQIPQINQAKRLGYEVNILGLQNVCEAVYQNPSMKGMILTGSWHVIGERDLRGVLNEKFGFRPDKVEDRARLYALCKIGQETIFRVYDEMSEKIYGVIRTGTVLGHGMPEKTAASQFITSALQGKPLTPFKHSMHRPMLYVDVNDVCKAFEVYAQKILSREIQKGKASLSNVVNFWWPKPITILELAEIIRDATIKHSKGKIKPKIEIIDQGLPTLLTPKEKTQIKVDLSKAKQLFGLKKMTNPKETIEKLVKEKIEKR